MRVVIEEEEFGEEEDFRRLNGMVMGFGVKEDGGVEGVGVEVVVWCLARDGVRQPSCRRGRRW